LSRRSDTLSWFGTGLGSALIVDNVLEPLELAQLPHKAGQSYEDYVGMPGLERLGKEKWLQEVKNVVKQLKAAMQVEYVVLAGGNARLIEKLPPGARMGNNADAFQGGFRLWSKRYCGSTHERFVH
jgi:polyphosphate glucokinase